MPPCREAADANSDGFLDLEDLLYMVNYMFRAGAASSPPLAVCGQPLLSLLGCAESNCP